MSRTGTQRTDDARGDTARIMVGAASAVLLIAFIAAGLAIDASRGEEPALVRVESVTVESVGSDTSIATVAIRNDGDATAEAILVRVEPDGQEPVDREVPFLAPDESDEVAFVVPRSTEEADVEASVRAWTPSR